MNKISKKVVKDLEGEDKVDQREEQVEEEEVLLGHRVLLLHQEDHLLHLMGQLRESVLLMVLLMVLLVLELSVAMEEGEMQETLWLTSNQLKTQRLDPTIL